MIKELTHTLTSFPPFFLLYTDPGSGMLLLQLIAAGFFGALFYLRKFKSKIFKSKNTAAQNDDSSKS